MYNDLLLQRLAASNLSPEDAQYDARIDSLIAEIEELENLLSPEARDLIEDLRPMTVSDDVYGEIDEHASLGDRLADRLALFAGSWGFIIFFGLVMLVWIMLNSLLGKDAFDPFPFILLNLTLSTLAALQAPVILMSQNRQATKDRAMAENDYQVNLKSELEIADLHRKLDGMIDIIGAQTRMINALVTARHQELTATVRTIEQHRTDPIVLARMNAAEEV